MSRTVLAREVAVGDVLETEDGHRMRVDRVGPFLFPGMVAFVEDSQEQWFKLCAREDDELTLLERAGAPA